MWESTTMSFGETLVASALGLLVVMTVLVILALAIIVMTKAMKGIGLGSEKKVTPTVQNVNENQNLDEENYAVVLAAVHEEISRMPGEFRVVKIAEIN